MRIQRYLGAFLYQQDKNIDLWYWIRDSGEILKVVNGSLGKKEYVPKSEIPDMVWLAIKIGAYETMSKVS